MKYEIDSTTPPPNLPPFCFLIQAYASSNGVEGVENVITQLNESYSLKNKHLYMYLIRACKTWNDIMCLIQLMDSINVKKGFYIFILQRKIHNSVFLKQKENSLSLHFFVNQDDHYFQMLSSC